MDPIGNKTIGFYGLSMVYTMSLFLDVIHIPKLFSSKINAVYILLINFYNIYIMSIHFHLFQCCTKLKLNPSRAFRLIRPVLIPGFCSASGWEYMTPPG